MIFSLTKIIALVALFLITAFPVNAAQRTDAGLTLLQSPSARASALGEAFSAASDDLSAFSYNPATLFTFENSRGTFLYEEGATDDSFGRISVGYPRFGDAFGLSVGYYDGGEASVFDGTTQRTVKAQTDLAVSLGYATHWKNKVAFGATAKIIRSELGETATANAAAGDFGLIIPVRKRLLFGMSVQNIGSELKFVTEGAALPRIVRAGFSWMVLPKKMPTTFLIDVPHYMNQSEVRPSAGIETLFGPMAFRAGYKYGSDLEAFSVGTGFLLGRASLDYSFGFVDEVDSRHRISLAMKFGRIHLRPSFHEMKREAMDFAWWKYNPEEVADSKPKTEMRGTKRVVVEHPTRSYGIAPKRRVYIVKKGDTLKSIAKTYYGYEGFWDDLYRANQHLLKNIDSIKPGDRLLLPEKL